MAASRWFLVVTAIWRDVSKDVYKRQGYALVVLFFAISLCKNTMNFHELKRPEAAIHYFLRFVAAKALVGYGMDIMLNVFSICNGIVTDMADSMGGILSLIHI